MTDIYKELAVHLDTLPAGFPETETGIEIQILKRLFTPEEANAATYLSVIPESAKTVAAKNGHSEQETEAQLYRMSKKGLITRFGKGPYFYAAANFILGIWEYHVNTLDEDLIHDVNAYIPILWDKTWRKQKTQQLRVIPVSEGLAPEVNVMPYEQAKYIIQNQSKIHVTPCICRKEQNMIGKGCSRPIETCLMLGEAAEFYKQNGIGRTISQNEAMDILNAGIDEGLVLQPSNSQNPLVICMCCGCCCLFLKNLNKFEAPGRIANSNYFARVDDEACIGCGSCETICQMEAVVVEEDKAVVNLDRCIGCGLCAAKCDSDAMMILKKPEQDRWPVPADTADLFMNMMQDRKSIL